MNATHPTPGKGVSAPSAVLHEVPRELAALRGRLEQLNNLHNELAKRLHSVRQAIPVPDAPPEPSPEDCYSDLGNELRSLQSMVTAECDGVRHLLGTLAL